jgi:hypothetical protein
VPDLGALAKSAGTSGLSFSEFLNIASANAGVTKEDAQKIKDNLGLTELEKNVFQKPKQGTQELYNQAFQQAGLADIKKKYEDLSAQIDSKRAALNEKVGAINENPWYSETSRVGQVKRLQELANADIGLLENQQNQLNNLYKQGIDEVNNLVTRTTNDFENDQNINIAKLNYLEKQAESQLTGLREEKAQQVYRYMPEYMAGVETGKQTAAKEADITAKKNLMAQGYNIDLNDTWDLIAKKVAQKDAADKAASNSSSGNTTFTSTQSNKGATNAEVSSSDFSNFSDEAKNYFVNGMTQINDIKKTIDANKDKASQMEEEISSADYPPEVKDYLVKYVKKVAGGSLLYTPVDKSNDSEIENPFK